MDEVKGVKDPAVLFILHAVVAPPSLHVTDAPSDVTPPATEVA
jgi:hypothetical protein